MFVYSPINSYFVSVLFSICFIFVLSFFLFSRQTEINPINLVNATSKHIYPNFLFNLPSSSHWNVTNHFSNQNSAHAVHSNTQFNFGFITNSNENKTSSIRNQRDEQFAMNFDNELRQRHFNPMINQNLYHGNSYCDLSKRTKFKYHRPTKIGRMFEYMAHFMEKYQTISYVITGIMFYAILIYIFFY